MTLEEEINELKYQNKKLDSLVTKAWHIIGLIDKCDIPDDIKAAIKTWQYLQGKARKDT